MAKTSAEYREYRDAVDDLVDHIGPGCTVVQRAICEETAGIIVWCRRARLSLLTDGEAFDIASYTTATNALRRLLADIGQDRRMRDVTKTLDAYEAEHRAAARAVESFPELSATSPTKTTNERASGLPDAVAARP